MCEQLTLSLRAFLVLGGPEWPSLEVSPTNWPSPTWSRDGLSRPMIAGDGR